MGHANCLVHQAAGRGVLSLAHTASVMASAACRGLPAAVPAKPAARIAAPAPAAAWLLLSSSWVSARRS